MAQGVGFRTVIMGPTLDRVDWVRLIVDQKGRLKNELIVYDLIQYQGPS